MRVRTTYGVTPGDALTDADLPIEVTVEDVTLSLDRDEHDDLCLVVERPVDRSGERHKFRNHSGKFAAFRNVHDPHHDFRGIFAEAHDTPKRAPHDLPNGPGATARFAMVVAQYPDLLQPADVP